MDISGKSVLILGGYGLVGQAVARRLVRERPREMVLLSLRRAEAEEAVATLAPECEGIAVHAAWGDIFTFADVKDEARRDLFGSADFRTRMIESLPDGRLLPGPETKIPPASAGDAQEVTPERVEAWARAGWVDLREENMALWQARFRAIEREMDAIPAADSSSRFLRDRQFWGEEGRIQPGKVVGWIFATEEKGARMK